MNHDDDAYSPLSGAVRSALGLLADGIDKARHIATPAGERARQVGEKVREESSDVLGKVRDEGSHVVGKLRDHVPGGARAPHAPDADEMRQKAAEALDIAKTVAAALLVGGVKAVQFAMREWQAHTGSASTPEDNAPHSAWDTASRGPGASTGPASGGDDRDEPGTPVAYGTVTNEPQPAPEINNWDAVEAEVSGDPWAAETDDLASERDAGGEAADGVGTAGGDPVAGLTLPADEVDDVVYSTESDLFDETPTVATHTDDSVAGAGSTETDGGPALRAETPPTHAGHAGHTEPPVEGFDEMTIGSLRGRLGSFDLAQLESLRDYERTHSARPQVMTMIENRIAKVTAHPNDA
jgi:hypothetical protein